MGKDDATDDDTSNNEPGISQEHTDYPRKRQEHSGNNVSFVSEGVSERAAELRRQERRRQMNTIHSRRKRERQKIEVEVLREQCAQYSALNLSLFHKNKRLEELLELAKQAVEQHEKLFGVPIPSYQPPYSDMQRQTIGLSFSGALQLNPIQPPPSQPQLDPVTLQAFQLLLMQQLPSIQQAPQIPVVASLPNPAPPISNDTDPSQQQLQRILLQQLLLSGMSPEQIVSLFVPGASTATSERTRKDDDFDRKPPPKPSQG